MTEATTFFLSQTQKYAAGALFAIALNQAQVHQVHPLGYPQDDESGEERISDCSCSSNSGSNASSDSVSEDLTLWVNEHSGLLRLVFRFLEIDEAAWTGLEQTAGSSPAKHHVGAFMRLLALPDEGSNEQCSDQELAISKAVDVMEESMGLKLGTSESDNERHRLYEQECRLKLSGATERQQKDLDGDVEERLSELLQVSDDNMNETNDVARVQSVDILDDNLQQETMLTYPRKMAVLYVLLSGCLADRIEDDKKCPRGRSGYDARHRVAVRLLATWFDISWSKVEAAEMMIAFSAMAVAKEEKTKEADNRSSQSHWAKWKRGAIIGTAAVTGGTLLAITGGLAAPAIAAGFGALAPTLGTIIPVIGASGFAAAASAAGTVAGSVAVAASFGAAGAGLAGTKMARRTGSVDEFEFKSMMERQSLGLLAVEILVSGFVFDEQDFVRPWEGLDDNMERYALQWESKNLISVSTAIQDWLTSRITLELMKRGAMMTVLSTLMVALAWPATLLAATDFIDSKWTIAIDRSDKAGKLLAEVLLKGLHGNRPVTLVGYSLGARVVFKCLQTLAETEQNAEIVERVVLLGAPISISDESWEAARKMVAGRFVNAYSTNDWTLGFAFRASLLSQGLAGIQPIKVPGIENVNITDLVEGHSSYLWGTQQILEQVELDAYYPVCRTARRCV